MAGTIKKKGNGRYMARLFIGYDQNGKRKYWSVTVDGKKNAELLLAEKIREKGNHGTVMEPAKITLSEYLKDWMETTAKNKVSEKTYQNYQDVIKSYINPQLGAIPLNKLAPEKIQKHYNFLQKKKKKTSDNNSKSGRDSDTPEEIGLSPATIKKAHNVLRGALKQAVRWRKMPFNPCDLVDLPKMEQKELKALTQEEVKAFLDAVKGDRFETLFELLVVTGVRPGEALGLKWSDLDIESRTLTIKRTLSRPNNGKEWILKEPKTKKSRRTIPIPLELIESLKRHKVRQEEERLNFQNNEIRKLEKSMERGEAYVPKNYGNYDLIFTNSVGNPADHQSISNLHFKPVALALGLEGVRLYDLRHTCASLLAKAGESPRVVADLLGHSDTNITMNIYTHTLPGMKEAASNKMRKLIY